MNYNKLCSNELVQKLANEVRNGTISQTFTGKELFKQSLEYELRLNNPRDIIDINSEMNEIWNSRLTDSQKKPFMRLADRINSVRNSDTIDRISRINTPQITKTAFEDFFFNGTDFREDKSFESLILPMGMDYKGSQQ
ncbi:hypothetical protein GLOIN_2v1782020 [Rhizophagus clarus]|nr:hypothetical protein GLOIN_2v1782020 [Rhizophagus clarus]